MILIVDDHEDIRVVMTRLLTMRGYAVKSVCSGEEALEYLRSSIPPLVLLDYNMPGMNGLTVLTKIRADERLRKIKVIMFTASDTAMKQECTDAGADGFFQKGADFAELGTMVARFWADDQCSSPRSR